MKGFAPVWILVGVFILVAAGGGFLWGRTTLPFPIDVTMPTIPPSPTNGVPRPGSSDETANWQTYNDSTYSFKYPSDWKIVRGFAIGEPDLMIRSADYALSSKTGGIGGQILKSGASISFVAYSTTESSIQEQFSKDPLSSKIASNRRNTIIDGNVAIQYDIDYENSIGTHTRFLKEGTVRIVIIAYPPAGLALKDKEVYNLLLNSFKFN